MSAKKYIIEISTKIPSGWGPWRLYERFNSQHAQEARLHNLKHSSGFDPQRFQFRKVNAQ